MYVDTATAFCSAADAKSISKDVMHITLCIPINGIGHANRYIGVAHVVIS